MTSLVVWRILGMISLFLSFFFGSRFLFLLTSTPRIPARKHFSAEIIKVCSCSRAVVCLFVDMYNARV